MIPYGYDATNMIIGYISETYQSISLIFLNFCC